VIPVPTDESFNNKGQFAFRTTQWTMVLKAKESDSPLARDALERLCSTYWFPLYAFIRRKGHSPHNAQDLVQGFFEQLLENSSLRSVEREKGKFRTFLLASLTHFLANEWDRQTRLKRGGGCQTFSIDAEKAEDRFAHEPADPAVTPDGAFDRAWAQTVFQNVITRLREEYRKTDDEERFDALKQCLMGANTEEGYIELGARLQLSEGGIKTSIRRMRLRFRELLRAELAETLAEGMDVDQEIREMIAALR
jgi:RNA polymerase sigma factor (sigma-70 family)